MSLSLQDVEKIAGLARLALTDEEKARNLEQLSAILEYAER
jgi:aspartyl-tRNA(Asn)/glutamyl-tRNA(Gln) amidotransferase subunit C